MFAFSVIFVKLRKMDATDRENKDNIFSLFVSKYKPQFYYWEFVLFLRRVLVAMFSVYIYNQMLIFAFVAIIGIFLLIHFRCQPFIMQSANNLEAILLFGLILVIVLQGLEAVNDELKAVILSILIFLPFVLAIYFIYRFIKSDEYKQELVDRCDEDDIEESEALLKLNEDISDSDGDEVIAEHMRHFSEASTVPMKRLLSVKSDYQLLPDDQQNES